MNKKENVTNQDKALDFAKELIDEKGELLSSKIRKVSKDDKHFAS